MRYKINDNEYEIKCDRCKRQLGGRDEPAAWVHDDHFLCPRHHKESYAQYTIIEDDE